MSSSTVVNITLVILDDEKDWMPWIEVIRTAAGDLWDYVNPAIPTKRLKKLQEPVEPTPASVHTPSLTPSSQTQDRNSLVIRPLVLITEVTFSDLSASKQAQLQMLQNLYLYKLKAYKTKVKVINDLHNKVQ